MPLSMKKIGMRKPKPIASSLLVIGSLSSPWMKRRTTTPAANGTEQDVEAQLLGQVDEQDDQQDRDPHGQLRRRVEVLAHERDETGRMHLRGEEGGDHSNGDEEGEEEEGQPGVTVREQYRHRHDRAELADGAHRQDGGPDRRVQHLGVVQDRAGACRAPSW